MRITTNKLDFLSDVLEDFCDLHKIELMSADDILYGSYRDKLTSYQISWLEQYIETWDIIQEECVTNQTFLDINNTGGKY